MENDGIFIDDYFWDDPRLEKISSRVSAHTLAIGLVVFAARALKGSNKIKSKNYDYINDALDFLTIEPKNAKNQHRR